MNDRTVSKRQRHAKKTLLGSVTPDTEADGCSLSLRKSSARKSDEIDQRLPNNTLINLASITHIHKSQEILADIKLEKLGTPCKDLDPQHIWSRFRRYNLKRDKQILPIVALRAFIKGWLADAPQSYISTRQSNQARQNRALGNTHTNTASVARCSRPETEEISTQNPSLPSHEEVLDFYAGVVNKGGYIPQAMISAAMMQELRATGRV